MEKIMTTDVDDYIFFLRRYEDYFVLYIHDVCFIYSENDPMLLYNILKFAKNVGYIIDEIESYYCHVSPLTNKPIYDNARFETHFRDRIHCYKQLRRCDTKDMFSESSQRYYEVLDLLSNDKFYDEQLPIELAQIIMLYIPKVTIDDMILSRVAFENMLDFFNIVTVENIKEQPIRMIIIIWRRFLNKYFQHKYNDNKLF